jgi:hypothetical protein
MCGSVGGGRYAIAYNGELYNFQELRAELIARGCLFRSNTDTEVLLWLYELCGPAMLSRLSGARLLACLIVAPQRGYDEPGILSYAISSFCPTNPSQFSAFIRILV